MLLLPSVNDVFLLHSFQCVRFHFIATNMNLKIFFFSRFWILAIPSVFEFIFNFRFWNFFKNFHKNNFQSFSYQFNTTKSANAQSRNWVQIGQFQSFKQRIEFAKSDRDRFYVRVAENENDLKIFPIATKKIQKSFKIPKSTKQKNSSANT